MKQMLLLTGVFDRFFGGNSKDENPEHTIEYYNEKLNEYKDAEAALQINIATIYFEYEDIKESMEHLKKALQIYNELEDIGKQELVKGIIDDINQYNRKISMAIENYNNTQTTSSQIPLEDNKKVTEITEINNTLDHNQKYIETSSQIPVDEILLSDYNKINNNIIEAIEMLKGTDSYISYLNMNNPLKELKNAYEISNKIGNNSGKAVLQLLIGNVLLKESKVQDALQNFKKSLDYISMLMIKQQRQYQGF